MGFLLTGFSLLHAVFDFPNNCVTVSYRNLIRQNYFKSLQGMMSSLFNEIHTIVPSFSCLL